MLTHKTLVVIFSIFVTGCAAVSYKMSDNAIAIRSKMSPEEALAIVHKQLYPSGRQTGLCGVSPRVGDAVTPGASPSKLVSTKGNTITYVGQAAEAVSSSVSGNVMGGTGVLTSNYKFYDAPFTMDLTKLAYIGVEENTHFNEPVNELGRKRRTTRFNDQGNWRLSVLPCPAGQLVLLYAGAFQQGHGSFLNRQGGIPSVGVHVAPDNLDSFLAALSYLSPSVTIRLGTNTIGG